MKRVLLVDDDPDLLATLTMVLEADYAIVTAENGRDALARVLEEAFDAVVLDLMMPVLDGDGFLAELRERRIDVPILIASAATDLARRARGLGVVDFLEKPFDLEALERKLAALTGRNA